MDYVDGFIVAVPTVSREAYRAVAEKGARLFKDHGALQVVETWATTFRTARSHPSRWR